jgi:hypothetical protein
VKKKKKKATGTACNLVLSSMEHPMPNAHGCVSGTATAVHCFHEQMRVQENQTLDARNQAAQVSNQQNISAEEDKGTTKGGDEEYDVTDFMAAWAWKREHLYATYPTAHVRCVEVRCYYAGSSALASKRCAVVVT